MAEAMLLRIRLIGQKPEREREGRIRLAGGGATDVHNWARRNNVDRHDMNNAIHKLKKANGLGGRDNVIIDDKGEVTFQQQKIDNIWNYLK